jgi:hypothetical protein
MHCWQTRLPARSTHGILDCPFYEVDHCLVQVPAYNEIQCRFEYSPQIMVTTCILTFSKTVVMICIWAMRKWQSKKQRGPQKVVLYTLGDVIASFMRDPDETTKNMCLATRDDFRSRRTLKNRLIREDSNPSQVPREWKYVARSWMAAASVRRWMILIFLQVVVFLLQIHTCLLLSVLRVRAGSRFRNLPTRKSLYITPAPKHRHQHLRLLGPRVWRSDAVHLHRVGAPPH